MLSSMLDAKLPAYLFAAYICFVSLRIIYRLFFHPLRNFPGPKLAAVTYWYETYYDVFKDGKGLQFPEHIQHLHRQYGPIVRITPNELHVGDADSYSSIHNLGTQWHKDFGTYYPFHASNSTFGAISNDVHKERRKLLSSSFSRQSIFDAEELIRNEAELLVRRVKRASMDQVPLNARRLFRAYAADVIMKLAMNRPPQYLEAEDMGHEFFGAIELGARNVFVFKNFQWLCPIVFNIPAFIGYYISGDMYPLLEFQNSVEKQVRKEIDAHDEEKGQEKARETEIDSPSKGSQQPRESQTIFSRLLDSLPSQVSGKRKDAVLRLIDEGTTVLGAAVETVETTLTTTLRVVLAKPDICRKLREELRSAFVPGSGGNPTLIQLEKIPYLTAVIKEGLRLSWGIPARLGRVAPVDTVLCGKTVPAGTCVSTIPALVNLNVNTWGSDAELFKPERWLRTDGDDMNGASGIRGDDRNLASFSKGARGCLGINLAWAELYYAIGLLVMGCGKLEVAESSANKISDEQVASSDVCRDLDLQLPIMDRRP